MKHALLIEILSSFLRKASPFSVLDTHAGIGFYDLRGDAAEKTGEWRGGIGALRSAPREQTAPLTQYLECVSDAGLNGLYPGSPAIVSSFLREQDSLVCCELHPEDAVFLKKGFRSKRNIHVHQRDGYEALSALLPPRDARRGMVLIDPPFEQVNEFEQMLTGLIKARSRFANGILVGWYPIKHRAPVRAFHDALIDAGLSDTIAAELTLFPPLDPTRLNGAGVVVSAPPFGFAERAEEILSCLARVLGGSEARGSVVRLTAENTCQK